MERDSPVEARAASPLTSLESQLREIYGRAAYTHKAHEKMADGYVNKYRKLKALEIALSAAASGSLLIAVFADSRAGTIVGAVLSTVLLGITLYFKEAALGEQAHKHTLVGARLWGVREALLSLIVDMHDGRRVEEVREERDRLNGILEDIYRTAPRTDSTAYAAAQVALKEDEELFFADHERDRMLPKRLRMGSQDHARSA